MAEYTVFDFSSSDSPDDTNYYFKWSSARITDMYMVKRFFDDDAVTPDSLRKKSALPMEVFLAVTTLTIGSST